MLGHEYAAGDIYDDDEIRGSHKIPWVVFNLLRASKSHIYNTLHCRPAQATLGDQFSMHGVLEIIRMALTTAALHMRYMFGMR